MYKRWQSVCCNRVETFPPNKIVFLWCLRYLHKNAPNNEAGGWGAGAENFFKNGKQHCSHRAQSNHKANGPKSTLAAYWWQPAFGIALLWESQPPTQVGLTDAVVLDRIHKLYAACVLYFLLCIHVSNENLNDISRVHVLYSLVFLYFGRIHRMAISSAWRGQLQRLGRV